MSTQSVVYIVDDDAGIRGALSLLIESAGWSAEAFASSEAFLDAYTPSEGDCLVLDLHLPGMNGAELLTELRARNLYIPTVIITARPEAKIAAQAKREGALAVLTKPFAVDELLPRLEQAMERTRKTR